MAAEINVGGWHEDVARIQASGVANATPDVVGKAVEPAVNIPVVVTLETPKVPEATAPEIPVVPTVPKV